MVDHPAQANRIRQDLLPLHHALPRSGTSSPFPGSIS